MTAQLTPRDRLIHTATELFYERGLSNVGINEVTDRANVARMTLYNNFASKEALVLAVFEKLAAARHMLISKHIEQAQTAVNRVKAMFDVAEELAFGPRFRGCAFINAAAQECNPQGKIHALVRDHKNRLKAIFRENAKEAGHKQPELVAQQLLALWDGSIIEAFIQGDPEPIHACREAAALLISAEA